MRALKVSFILFIILAILFWKGGYIVDATQKPVKSDIIAVLGGDWEGKRIEKGLKLYREGYSNSGLIVVNKWSQIYVKEKNGTVYRKDDKYLLGHGVAPSRIVAIVGAGKTMYEIRAIKRFMLDHHLHSVLIVTDAPHSRRVRILADTLEGFSGHGLKLTVVAAGHTWWNKADFYKNPRARSYMLEEMIKIPANYFKYGILERSGLLPYAQKIYEPFGYKIKQWVQSFTRAIGSRGN